MNARWLAAIASFAVACLVFVAARRRYPEKVHKMIEEKLGESRHGRHMGEWGEWSAWGECSRTCGTGVKIQSRSCNKVQHRSSRRGSLSSNRCVGRYKRFQLCKIENCPGRPTDFRTDQCKEFDNKEFKGRKYSWEPYLQGDQCQLNCVPKGFRFYATLKEKVTDGTPCRAEPGASRAVCVTGRCKQVGCDGVIGSGQRYDTCGICGGDNKTCKRLSGIYMRAQLPQGYNQVTRFPPGACNINITQLKPTSNYLAVRKINGPYIVNGAWGITSGVYEGGGTQWTYQGKHGVIPESIYARGPITEHLDLKLVYRHVNLGIKYEYSIPLGRLNPNQPRVVPAQVTSTRQYYPSHQQNLPPGYNNVTASNNRGYPRDGVFFDNRGRPAAVTPVPYPTPNGFGLLGTDPRPSVRKHHKHRRGFRWRAISMSTCSRTCGGGFQTPTIVCMKDRTGETVSDRMCSGKRKPPAKTVRCATKPCPAEWVAEDWGPCSVTCGTGIQKRSYGCRQTLSPSLNIEVTAGACLSSIPPPETKPCHSGPCGHWKASRWSQCNVGCGKGIQRRGVECLSHDGKQLQDLDCDRAIKPITVNTCDMGSCSSNTWFFTEWSGDCEGECGNEMQSRQTYCSSGSSNAIPESNCDQTKKPRSSQPCSPQVSCSKGKWFTGPWGKCSVDCGSGTRSRSVVCMISSNIEEYQQALPTDCNGRDKPDTEEECDLKPCGPRWYFTDWSKCPVTCGGGKQTREIKCINKNQRPTEASECPAEFRPKTTKDCNLHRCPGLEPQQRTEEQPSNTRKDTHIQEHRKKSNGRRHRKKAKERKRCVDHASNCHLVIQARLCHYAYYKNVCCKSCKRKS